MTPLRPADSPLERDDPILGRVRLCRGCGEDWPLDTTFWYAQGDRPMGRCRACWSERSRVDGKRQAFAPLVTA